MAQNNNMVNIPLRVYKGISVKDMRSSKSKGVGVRSMKSIDVSSGVAAHKPNLTGLPVGGDWS